jgi:hypothetical protein
MTPRYVHGDWMLSTRPWDRPESISSWLLFHREPTDCVEISRRLYEGQTVEEIFEQAKREWTEQ